MSKNFTKLFYLFYWCIFIACQNSEPGVNTPVFQSFPVKPASEIEITDFLPASECESCHPDHFDEWSHSMHASAMKDPIFLRGWNDEQELHPDTGERFCIQCHSPVSFITGTYLNNISTAEDMEDEEIPAVIQEGIGCDYCHSITRSSPGVVIEDNLVATAEYNLYPGEGIKYGSIESPSENDYHTSVYNPLFEYSGVCLPCHNMTVRGNPAEMTFTEWEDASEFSMGNRISCQECHMPLTIRKAAINGPTREVHKHIFVGVDLDLSQPAEQSPQYNAVIDLLKSAVTLEFGTLIDSINIGDLFSIPVVVSSNTGHSLPSGVSFAREAWLELIVRIDDSILFQSGLLASNTDSLKLSDNNLLLFTSYLISDTLTGKITSSVSETMRIIDHTLKASTQKSHLYEFQLSADQIPENSNGEIAIQLRMLFRPFKPHLLEYHESFLVNLPIFEMASLLDTVYIKSP